MNSNKRQFQLPNFEELSQDQELALAAPLDGQFLVTGGPGTGKSVVALLRALRLEREKIDYRFLVFNHVLKASNDHLFGSGSALKSYTWDQWFRKQYSELVGAPVPLLPPARNRYREIDWVGVEKVLDEWDPGNDSVTRPHIVIDEGQDMPPGFYNALVSLGYENFYVVADQNQQLHYGKCSSFENIRDALGVSVKDVLKLSTNYRNTHRIAALAQHFWPGDIASGKIDLPPVEESALTPLLVQYNGDEIYKIASRVLKISDANPSELIGIITPTQAIQERFLMALEEVPVDLDGERPSISAYASGKNSVPLDFSKGGVMVLNAKSCKGLEFDTAILADIDSNYPPNREYELKSLFYVMVSRARKRAILLRNGQPDRFIESLLPDDDTILNRNRKRN